MIKSIKITIGVLASLMLISCAESGSDSSSSESSSFSISGSLGVGGSSSSSLKLSAQDEFYSLVSHSVSAQSSACSDGNHYKVYCVSFSENPVAASGSVTCSGGSTGSYTVAGLPKNTPIGCFVQMSSDGSSFSTAGTIELTQEGSMGGNSNINAEGDMGVNITIATNGKISSEVTKDARKAPTNIAKIDPSTFNGIYQMTCDNTKGGTLFSQERCKCFLGEDQYSGPGYNNQDECLAANGAGLTNVSMYIDINIYNATAGQDITENGTKMISAGEQVQGVTVWGAQDSSTTTRQGGEGLSQFQTDMGLTFADSQATTAISWSTSANMDKDDGTTTATTVGTVPANNANVGAWQSWLQSIVSSAITNSEFTCTQGVTANVATDAGCIQQFTDQILDKIDSETIPRVHYQPHCDHNGCVATMNEGRIWVEGIDFNYDHSSWSGSQASVTAKSGGSGASPRNRFVFEQWHNYPGGGGGFTQRDGRNRYYQCSSSSGKDVQHSSCTASNDGLECFMEEEMSIRMLPTSTTGAYDMVFESRNVVYGGQFHINSNTSGPVFNADAQDLCRQKISQEGAFMATATKQ